MNDQHSNKYQRQIARRARSVKLRNSYDLDVNRIPILRNFATEHFCVMKRKKNSNLNEIVSKWNLCGMRAQQHAAFFVMFIDQRFSQMHSTDKRNSYINLLAFRFDFVGHRKPKPSGKYDWTHMSFFLLDCSVRDEFLIGYVCMIKLTRNDWYLIQINRHIVVCRRVNKWDLVLLISWYEAFHHFLFYFPRTYFTTTTFHQILTRTFQYVQIAQNDRNYAFS